MYSQKCKVRRKWVSDLETMKTDINKWRVNCKTTKPQIYNSKLYINKGNFSAVLSTYGLNLMEKNWNKSSISDKK